MPRILAIDWDRLEARALLLQAGPTGTSVMRAWIVPLEQVDHASPTGSHLGKQLAAALAGEPLGKVTTLVGVGRDQVQMKLLSLPPAPAEELPELVRFQAEREFTSLGEDSALDFIPLAGDATTPHQVLAAALAGSSLGEVNNVCQALGSELTRVTLRACGAASFVARSSIVGANEISLVANRFEDEADLTVLSGDKIVFVRTVRLADPSNEAARDKALASEIRRTLAAVRQQLGDQQVGKVVLCGTADDSAEAASLATDLGLPVAVFDVAAHAPTGLARAGVPSESAGRLAAVLGMALGEADRRRRSSISCTSAGARKYNGFPGCMFWRPRRRPSSFLATEFISGGRRPTRRATSPKSTPRRRASKNKTNSMPRSRLKPARSSAGRRPTSTGSTRSIASAKSGGRRRSTPRISRLPPMLW